jgi:hypothetical protein
MGDGSSPCSLSRAGIWRLVPGAASFPTLFSTASGVIGHVAGPLSRPVFACRLSLLSEASQLARLMVAPPAHKPGQDAPAISLPHLDRLAQGRLPLLTGRWPAPRVWPLNSQVAFFSQISGLVLRYR